MIRFSLLGLVLLATAAHATDCPPAARSCKVITLTPDEENALVQQNGILDTAERARFLDMSGVTNYFRRKIADAPPGDVKEPPKPQAPAGEPSKP